MKASNIFKYFIRLLFILFIVTFSLINFNNGDVENLDKKLNELGKKDNSFTSADSQWKELDKKLSSKQIKKAIKFFEKGEFKKSDEAIYKAKLIAADLKESPLFIKINKTEKAIQNALKLKTNFKEKNQINSKLVQVVSNSGDPVITGHILKKSKFSILIQDLDGFQRTLLNKNSTVKELSANEKTKHYKEMFESIKADNGINNSYGLYQSASWAYNHKLERDVNKILLAASMNDSEIISTIFDENAKKVLRVALWSKVIGNYDTASLNANIIVKDYSSSKYVIEAKAILDELSALKLKAQEKQERKRKAIALAVANKKIKDLEEKKLKDLQKVQEDKTDNPPVNSFVLIEATTEPVKEIEKKEPGLTLVKVDQEKAVELPPEEKTERPPAEAEIEDDFKDGVFANAKFQQAQAYVKEAKKILKKAMSYQNPGHKKAQSNFRKSKKVFIKARNIFNKLAKKYDGDEDFEEISGEAAGCIFFLNKSCIRHH